MFPKCVVHDVAGPCIPWALVFPGYEITCCMCLFISTNSITYQAKDQGSQALGRVVRRALWGKSKQAHGEGSLGVAVRAKG